MSDGTTAVPKSLIENPDMGIRRALCPRCVGGRLHPYKVEVNLGGFQGFRYGTGWVAVCIGSDGAPYMDTQTEPCGFSMQIEPHR